MNAKFDPIQGFGMTSLRTRQRLVRRLREAGIHDETVLQVIEHTPRHLFVDEALASRAYEETALPIGFAQTLSQPYIVALMTATLLEGRRLNRVLEIGTGSGYQTAVLAALVSQVYSVERVNKLLDRARERLRLLELRNIRLKYDDGQFGWSRYAPFDGIMVTAAADEVPAALLAQLTVGGRLVAPVGRPQAQQLVRIERTPLGFDRQTLGPVSFVPLLPGLL